MLHQHDPLDINFVVERTWSWNGAVWRRENAWSLPLDDPLALIHAIWTALNHLRVTRYLIVASFTLGFYDYFLTLPQEQAYVWKSRPSIVRSIYFFVRYSYFPIGVLTLYEKTGSAPPGGLSDMFCRVWFITEITWQFCITASIQCLMLLRVSAYWGSEYPCLKKALILIYSLCTMATAALQMWAVSKIYPSRYKYSPEINCCATMPPKITAAYYAPYLFMEIILFVLTFWRWHVMRKSHPVGVSIIHIFFRDGMIYFAVIFAMAAWSLLTYLCVTLSLVGSAFYPSYTFTTLCACRLVLSIRSVHQFSTTPSSETGIQFDHDVLNIEMDERDPGSRVRDIFDCRPTRRRSPVQSLTVGSVNSLRYDQRRSTDLPTVDEGLGKIEEDNGTPIHSLWSRPVIPSVLQRNNPIQGHSGDRTVEKEKEVVFTN